MLIKKYPDWTDYIEILHGDHVSILTVYHEFELYDDEETITLEISDPVGDKDTIGVILTVKQASHLIGVLTQARKNLND